MAVWLSVGLAGLLPDSSLAQDPGMSSEAAQAEYVRLSRELQRLGERNAWSGVERTYQSILANGAPASQEDHILGARAAKQAGDAASVRERLERAIALGENAEAYDWAWEFDSTYGRVDLAADPGTHTLTPETMPFQPDLAAAVRFAQASIAEDGMFKGFLPQGNYSFGPYSVEVMPRVSSIQIDARGSVPADRPDRTEREPRPDRAPRDVRPPPPERPPREAREPRVKPEGDVGDGHLVALTVGAGNRYGGGVGGGVNALFRVPVESFGVGAAAGVGYDVGWAAVGYHVGGRLYFPAIVSQLTSATFYVGGGYSPMVYFENPQTGALEVAQRPHVTPIGLDLRVGQFVIDSSFELTRATGFGPEEWFAGYGVGIGFGFP